MSEDETNMYPVAFEPTAEAITKFLVWLSGENKIKVEDYYLGFREVKSHLHWNESDIPFPDGWLGEYFETEGGEGEGDYYHFVFSLTKDKIVKYFLVPGWYASYHGSELQWSNLVEVVKGEKVVEVWKSPDGSKEYGG